MANIFCPSCGSKSTYNLSPPNFCGKCGLPYIQNKTYSARLSQSRFSSKKVLQQENDDDFEDLEDDENQSLGSSYFSDSSKVPRITKLNVDIDSSTDVRVFKFSDLFSEKNIDNDQFNK